MPKRGGKDSTILPLPPSVPFPPSPRFPLPSLSFPASYLTYPSSLIHFSPSSSSSLIMACDKQRVKIGGPKDQPPACANLPYSNSCCA